MSVRVAMFTPALVTGGTQRHLQQVVERLDRRRFEPIVYALKTGGEIAESLVQAGVEVRFAPVQTRVVSLATGRTIRRITAELRATRVQIVHGYQWRPALVGALAGRLAGVPVVLASKRSLSGQVRTERWAWRVLGRFVDGITVNATAIRDEAVAHGVRSAWTVVRNGIDAAAFTSTARPPTAAARRAIGLDPDRPVVGTIGRLERRKGHDDLLRAARHLHERAEGVAPQIVVVGDGPERNSLEKLASGLGLGDDVRFTGTVADVRPWLAAMDVFVLPSLEEGSPNAVLEAMASARPIVATRVGGIGELLEDGRTGWLVPPRNPTVLAGAIASVLNAPDEAARRGAAARDVVLEHYDVSCMVRAIESLWEDWLARCGTPRWRMAGEVRPI